MATENPWRARKIQAELAKLEIRVSLATISRYLSKARPGPGQHARWMTFLRNHKDLIAGMDFFVVPTVHFSLLYVWFILDHGRRRALHFHVTTNPTASWVIQQLRPAFPDEFWDRPEEDGVKIVIDRATCLSSGQCAYMQPELFDFSDEDGPSVKVERLETDAQLEQAREAIAMCPSQALPLAEDRRFGSSIRPESRHRFKAGTRHRTGPSQTMVRGVL